MAATALSPEAVRAELLALAERIGKLGGRAVLAIAIDDPALLTVGDIQTYDRHGLTVYESAIIERGDVEIELFRSRPVADDVRAEIEAEIAEAAAGGARPSLAPSAEVA